MWHRKLFGWRWGKLLSDICIRFRGHYEEILKLTLCPLSEQMKVNQGIRLYRLKLSLIPLNYVYIYMYVTILNLWQVFYHCLLATTAYQLNHVTCHFPFLFIMYFFIIFQLENKMKFWKNVITLKYTLTYGIPSFFQHLVLVGRAVSKVQEPEIFPGC